MQVENKKILFFRDDDFPSLLMERLKINKKSIHGWVVNGAYWFKWFDNGNVICCDEKYVEVKDKTSWSGYRTISKPDWDNPVGGTIKNVPKPKLIEIYHPGWNSAYYNEIIREAKKKLFDPDNYVPIKPKETLTYLDGNDTIPF